MLHNRSVAKAKSGTLYMRRPLTNASDVIDWAKSQGFPTTQVPSDMHATLAYSKQPVDWPAPHDDHVVVTSHADRSVEKMGDGACVALKFASPTLQSRWQSMCEAGAGWDYDDYSPHVTISWQVPDDFDLSKVEPYTGPLEFGPEVLSELDPDWDDDHTEKAMPAMSFSEIIEKVGARHTRKEFEQIQKMHDLSCELGADCQHDNIPSDQLPDYDDSAEKVDKHLDFKVTKVDDRLGVVFGWAIVSKEGGADYFDTQGDHIPEDAMLHAATDFMSKRRTMKVMHTGAKKGSVIFAWPMTSEIAKAMGIQTEKTGLMVGVKPDSKAVLDKFASGEYTGFSIGGSRVQDEDVD